MKNFFTNVIITHFFQQYFIYSFCEIRTDSEFPSIFTHLFFLQIFIYIDGFFFYWFHRMLHLPFFYKNIHKTHHINVINIVWSTIDSHPIEYFLGDMFPKYISLFMFQDKIHFITFITFMFTATLDAHFGHSGYSFPISPFSRGSEHGSSDHHYFHHLKNNGNFALPDGDGLFWDSLFGTDKPFKEYVRKMKAQKKNN